MDANVYCLGKCQPYSISDLGQVTGYFTVLFMQLSALSAQSQLSLSVCLCLSLSLSPSPSLSVVTKCITGRIERLVIKNEWVPTFAYKEVTHWVSQGNRQRETVDLGTQCFTQQWIYQRVKTMQKSSKGLCQFWNGAAARLTLWTVGCIQRSLGLPGSKLRSEEFQETCTRTLQTKSHTRRGWLSSHAQVS